MCPNALTCAYSPSGDFDGKSAYKLAKGGLECPINFSGQWIWKLDTVPKIQICVEMRYLHSLPVKDMLMSRGISEDCICEIFGRESKTAIHVWRDCSFAKDFWLH